MKSPRNTTRVCFSCVVVSSFVCDGLFHFCLEMKQKNKNFFQNMMIVNIHKYLVLSFLLIILTNGLGNWETGDVVLGIFLEYHGQFLANVVVGFLEQFPSQFMLSFGTDMEHFLFWGLALEDHHAFFSSTAFGKPGDEEFFFLEELVFLEVLGPVSLLVETLFVPQDEAFIPLFQELTQVVLGLFHGMGFISRNMADMRRFWWE